MTAVWGVVRAFWLRFAIVLGGLVVFPFPIGTIPKTDWLLQWIGWPFEKLGTWFGAAVFGLAAPSPPTGSGDRLDDYSYWLMYLCLSFLGALVWSLLDRHRKRYPRLEAAVLLGLRYSLALVMFGYGFAKILKSQMPDLRPGDLDTPLGELSPMGLAWALVGFSTPYSVFAGISEALGGALLLWRRTQTIGALVVIAVMSNVVAMNFCFDIPVKLYSTQLLLTAVVLLVPFARRLLAAAMGYGVPELPPRPRMAPRWERARWVLKIAVLVAIPLDALATAEHTRNDHKHELYGSWIVDEVSVDGVIRPPLATDTERWSRVQMNGFGMWTVTMTGERQPSELEVDAAKHTLQRTAYVNFVMAKGEHEVTETWRYEHATPDQLVLDGTRGTQHWHVTLHRAPPSLLLTRGFHWVNPDPMRARDRSAR